MDHTITNGEKAASDILEHWGIMGMRWGVRNKKRSSRGSRSSSRSRRGYSSEQVRALSDQDLQSAIRRIQMEQQLKSISRPNNATNDFISGIGQTAVKQAVTSTLAKAIGVGLAAGAGAIATKAGAMYLKSKTGM